jgi:hypothetical protein
MNLSTIVFSALFLVSVPVLSQAPSTQLTPPDSVPIPPQAAGYRIGQEDEIRLVVVGEDQFNAIYRVQTDDTIGARRQRPGKGLTTNDVAETIASRWRRLCAQVRVEDQSAAAGS